MEYCSNQNLITEMVRHLTYNMNIVVQYYTIPSGLELLKTDKYITYLKNTSLLTI